MHCKSCGKPLEEWKYCPRCGVSVDFEKIERVQKIRGIEREIDNTREELREEIQRKIFFIIRHRGGEQFEKQIREGGSNKILCRGYETVIYNLYKWYQK